ncbi:transmembrane protein 256 homolog [Teleopsis dalmanni]|uniref:transmembrane protein 256 homolog n=1 Tax=Teleopsis dalmanni TaxID=139649 RepID=UPI0018CE1578|nr:transmembrane protein 256 homolog [Teleopsis dalmanni]XP_037938048.1 transmembrane protein 256 homolog [Teleopsis dalmanni]
MTFSDILSYATVGNPVSKKIGEMFKDNANASSTVKTVVKATAGVVEKPLQSLPPLWSLLGRNKTIVKIAGLSGAAAVIIGAIGSHSHFNGPEEQDNKLLFETANRFHFFHSIVLLSAPIAKYPVVTGSLIGIGTLLFSGALYYRAFSGKSLVKMMAPFGGTCLIMGWLTFML